MTPGTIVRPRRAKSRGRVKWVPAKSAVVARLRKLGSFQAASRASKSEGNAEAVSNGTAGGDASRQSREGEVLRPSRLSKEAGSENPSLALRMKEMASRNAAASDIARSSSNRNTSSRRGGRGEESVDASMPGCAYVPSESSNSRAVGDGVATASEGQISSVTCKSIEENVLMFEEGGARLRQLAGSNSRQWMSRRVLEEEERLTSSLQQGSLEDALGRIGSDRMGSRRGASIRGIAGSFSRASGRLGLSGRLFNPSLIGGVRRGDEHVKVRICEVAGVPEDVVTEMPQDAGNGRVGDEGGGRSECGSGAEGDLPAGSAALTVVSTKGDRARGAAARTVLPAAPRCTDAAVPGNAACADATALLRVSPGDASVQKEEGEEEAGDPGGTTPCGPSACNSVAVNIHTLEARESDASTRFVDRGMSEERVRSGGVRKGEEVGSGEGGKGDGPSTLRELALLLEEEGESDDLSMDVQSRGSGVRVCGGRGNETGPAGGQLQAASSRKLRSEMESARVAADGDSSSACCLPLGARNGGVVMPLRAQERMPRESSEDSFFRRRAELMDRLESTQRAEQEPGKDYSFLWNDVDLDKRARESRIFSVLEDKVRDMAHGHDGGELALLN